MSTKKTERAIVDESTITTERAKTVESTTFPERAIPAESTSNSERFAFHRQPLAHQIRDFERFKNEPYHGLFYEQRVRKTKVELDIFRYRYDKGDVDTLLVIAYPNGVQNVWIDELPKDFPPDFLARTLAVAWRTSKMKNKAGTELLDKLVTYDGPKVIAMNCESIITTFTMDYLIKYFKHHSIHLVADESAWAGKFSKRTKALLKIGRSPSIKVRAILDGTPTSEGPEDLYFPTQFLKPGLLGFSTKAAFTSRYIKFEEEETAPGVFVCRRRLNRNTGTFFEVRVGTKNLDELQGRLAAFSTRVLRTDVSDAPPKTYQTRYFEMTAKQRHVYDTLLKKFYAELPDGPVSVPHVLGRLTKLQMISRNYYPPETTGVECVAPDCFAGFLPDGAECSACNGLGYQIQTTALQHIDDTNPAAEALTAELKTAPGPAIIWCRFRQDVTDAAQAVAATGRAPYLYYGLIPEKDREANYQAFKNGTSDTDTIIATLASGLTRGRDLSRASMLIYYSLDYSLRVRLQSEDRAESLDRKFSTEIVDLVAQDTRDIDIIKAHRDKKEISAIILGDPTFLR